MVEGVLGMITHDLYTSSERLLPHHAGLMLIEIKITEPRIELALGLVFRLAHKLLKLRIIIFQETLIKAFDVVLFGHEAFLPALLRNPIDDSFLDKGVKRPAVSVGVQRGAAMYLRPDANIERTFIGFLRRFSVAFTD